MYSPSPHLPHISLYQSPKKNMETNSIPFSRRLQRYWKRRPYERVKGEGKKNTKIVRLGGEKKRSWKIPAVPKLRWRLKMVSPIKILRKLRDAYVNKMLGWAGQNTGNIFGGRRIPRARKIEMDSKAGDFETKLIFEIYKSLKASRESEAR